MAQLESLPISTALKQCAQNIIDYEFHDPEVSIAHHPPSFPRRKLAAVLVLLYERDGMIRVLLTRRSKALRSHPGQTALPGGKSDEEDGTPVATALREADEEVALPLNSPHVHILRTIPPFPSLYKLIVTPVIALLTDISVLATLKPNPSEVDDIFDHPLEAFLDPSIMKNEPKLVPRGGETWPYPEELYNFSDSPFIANSSYRNNRFRSTSSPVKGFTSSIMVLVAQIGLRREPTFELYAPGHLPHGEMVRVVVEEVVATEKEGHSESNGTADALGVVTRESSPISE